MTNEELLIDKYKVIAWYPHCPFEVGFVLQADETGEMLDIRCGYPQSKYKVMLSDVKKATSNFKKMNWWEGVAPDDLPKYLLNTIYGIYVKVVSYGSHVVSDVSVELIDGNKGFDSLYNCIPATEGDFNNQNKKAST